MRPTVDEHGGRGDDAGSHARAEVAVHALRDVVGPAVGLEAIEVEPKAADAIPQVRVVEPSMVRVQRIVEVPVGALEPHGLGGLREHPRPRVLRHHREMAEHAPDPKLGQERIGARAIRALVVAVLDHQRGVGIAVHVVLRTGRRRPGGGQIGGSLRRRRGRLARRR